MSFELPDPNTSLPQIENEILEIWKAKRIFQASVEAQEGRNDWPFFDGPPFATGLPHHGHLLAGTIKDVVPRFWTMKGFSVKRRFGWDCHGLPIEFETEKNLNLKGRKDILDFGVDKFNEACRDIVLRYTKEWEKTVTRLGRWIDFDNDYKTMDLDFMESVWAVFKRLWDQGLIYEDTKVLPYSSRITSPLSNFEANLNYKDTQDPSVYVKFPHSTEANTYFVVWTTTPWTLPANLALAVNPEFTYDFFEIEGGDQKETWILERSRSEILFKTKGFLPESAAKATPKCIASKLGKDLKGQSYEPLFDCFKEGAVESAFSVLSDDFVDNTSGTGIVHIAPAFGEDDHRVGRSNGLDPVDHLDEEGIFVKEPAEGKHFKDADPIIVKDLKSRNLLVRQETIQHSYPFCYRSDTPLIYRAIPTWFVKVSRIQQQIMENNQQIHWVPEHIKDGRFGKWLENARDWAISRNRFWGNPLPIWRNEETGETLCVGSIEELETLSGSNVKDLHKHYVDKIEIVSPKTGDTLTRIPHVLDCWFESGSMPYAQNHFPFDMNEQEFKKCFPAKFIAEGLDQTRGWFYTLLVLSTALNMGVPFENVIVNGIVLAEDGRKMSKRLKNYPAPDDIFDAHGADTLRIYLLQSGAVHAEDLRFSSDGLKDMTRKVLLPFLNAYTFFATYAGLDNWNPKDDYVEARSNPLDKWIVLKLEHLKNDVNQAMENYHLHESVPPIITFLDHLTNWYIRRSRRRFWKSSNDQDKYAAYSTLHSVLLDFCKIAAPFIPFLTDRIYLWLTHGTEKASVHLDAFPEGGSISAEELHIEKEMDEVVAFVGLARDLREKTKIKNRQPLSKAIVGVMDARQEDMLKPYHDILKEELNVKSIEAIPFEDLASWTLKPNFQLLGKKLGKNMKAFSQATQSISDGQILSLLQGEPVEVLGENYDRKSFIIDLKPKDDFAHPCSAEGSRVIALDTNITPELKAEGLANELINRIQRYRKDCDFNVDDRIEIQIQSDSDLATCVEDHLFRIQTETLSQIEFRSEISYAEKSDQEVDGRHFWIAAQVTSGNDA